MPFNVNDFNFISEGVTDKVVFVTEGSTSYPTGTGENAVDIPVPPDLGLVMVNSAVSKDGISWVSETSPSYEGNSLATDLAVDSYSHPDRIRLFITAYPYTGTIYYRVLGIKR